MSDSIEAKTTTIEINFASGGIAIHKDIVGYQLAQGVLIVYDNQNTSHIYPLTTIQNITVTQ